MQTAGCGIDIYHRIFKESLGYDEVGHSIIDYEYESILGMERFLLGVESLDTLFEFVTEVSDGLVGEFLLRNGYCKYRA